MFLHTLFLFFFSFSMSDWIFFHILRSWTCEQLKILHSFPSYSAQFAHLLRSKNVPLITERKVSAMKELLCFWTKNFFQNSHLIHSLNLLSLLQSLKSNTKLKLLIKNFLTLVLAGHFLAFWGFFFLFSTETKSSATPQTWMWRLMKTFTTTCQKRSSSEVQQCFGVLCSKKTRRPLICLSLDSCLGWHHGGDKKKDRRKRGRHFVSCGWDSG